MTGRDPTEQERQRNYQVAQQVSAYTPMLVNLLGPDLVDQLHGRKGSATVFSQRLHQGLRTAIDPVTGQVGVSGDSAAVISNEIYERLYGRGADPSQMRGLRAGQAGLLAEELQYRGLLGPSIGAMSLNERLAGLPSSLDDGTVQRLAERLPGIAERVRAGEAIPETEMEDARQRIRRSRDELASRTGAGQELTSQDLQQIPGGEDIMRAGDAQRITSRLKGLAGVVSAMRDIFGDMGQPNAPMRQIINGLEALTQGSMATLSPAELERMVRMTHALSQQTGIGMQGMMGLMAQGAGLADRLGLDRSLAVQATQGTAAFGAAVGDTQSLHIPAWGSLSKEQLTLLDQQLRMTAAASPVANQLNAMLRMNDEGIINAGAGSELSAMLDAARAGQGSYTFGGETKSLMMNRNKMLDILERDGGVSRQAGMRFLSDRFGNQEYGLRYNTTDTVRELQRNEAQRAARNAFGGAALLEGGEEADIATLQAAGIVKDRSDFRRFANDIGSGMGDALFGLDQATLRDTGKRNAAMSTAFDASLHQAIRNRLGPDATEEQVEAAFRQSRALFGGDNAGLVMGASGWAALDTAVRTNPAMAPYGSAMGLMQTHNAETHAKMRQRQREAQAKATMQSAFAGLNSAGPLERIMDSVAEARADTTPAELLSKIMGGVAIDDVAQRDPVVQGVLKAMEAMQSAERDANGKLTDKGMVQTSEQAQLIRALREGGPAAQAELARLRKAGTLTPEIEAALTQASVAATDDSGGGFDLRMIRRGAVVGAGVSAAHVRATMQAGRDMERLLGGKDAAKAEEAAGAFLASSKERASALLHDDQNMAQLGAGGLDLIQGVEGKEKALRALAQKAGVSVAKLLAGGKGIDPALTKQARAIAGNLQKDWEEINSRRSRNLMPSGARAQTEKEKQAVASEREFRLQFGDTTQDANAEAQAAASVDALAAISGADTGEYLSVDVNKKKLTDAVLSGDRAVDIKRATIAHDQLMQMAIEKGYLKTPLAKSSAEERRKALEAMYADADAGKLDETTTQDIKRNREDRSLLGDVGLRDMSEEEAMAYTMKRIESFQGAAREQAEGEGGADKKVAMAINGTLRIIDETTAVIGGDGIADVSHTPAVFEDTANRSRPNFAV